MSLILIDWGGISLMLNTDFEGEQKSTTVTADRF